MKLIPLTQGKFVKVDDEDFETFNKYKWRAIMGRSGLYYAGREVNNTTVYLHREIMGCEIGDKKIIDHKDIDSLNCQKYNLRECTKSQNNKNRRPSKNSSSKYLGVSWCKVSKKWLSQITVNKKTIKLGRFAKEKDAAIKYNESALEYSGEFANINIIQK